MIPYIASDSCASSMGAGWRWRIVAINCRVLIDKRIFQLCHRLRRMYFDSIFVLYIFSSGRSEQNGNKAFQSKWIRLRMIERWMSLKKSCCVHLYCANARAKLSSSMSYLPTFFVYRSKSILLQLFCFFSSHSLVFFCLDRDNNASMLCNSSFVRRQLYECESSLIFESFHSNGFTLLSAPTHETAEYALFVCTHLNARMADARRKGIATKKMMAFFVFIISILCVSLHLPLTWNGNRIRPKVTVMKCYSIFSDAFGVVLILP